MAGSMILDTGATTHLMRTTINNLLAHAQQSNMAVRGAFGADRKAADQHGEGLIRFTYMTRQDTNLWAFRAAQRAAKQFLQSGDRDEVMRST